MANNIDSMTNQYMQISGRSTQTRSPDRAAEQSGQAAATSSGNAAQSVDTIQLTGDARLLQAVEQRLGAVQEVDATRVEDVRSRLESGSYTISAERTADKMLSMEQGMPETG